MIKLTDMLEKELIVRISTDSPFKGFLLTTQHPGEFIETKGFRKPNGQIKNLNGQKILFVFIHDICINKCILKFTKSARLPTQKLHQKPLFFIYIIWGDYEKTNQLEQCCVCLHSYRKLFYISLLNKLVLKQALFKLTN